MPTRISAGVTLVSLLFITMILSTVKLFSFLTLVILTIMRLPLTFGPCCENMLNFVVKTYLIFFEVCCKNTLYTCISSMSYYKKLQWCIPPLPILLTPSINNKLLAWDVERLLPVYLHIGINSFLHSSVIYYLLMFILFFIPLCSFLELSRLE